MKRKLLFGFLLLAYAFGNAQFQTINDPAFEDELIRLGHDSNPVRDGGISLSDAAAVTFLNLTGVDTNDVTETFTAPGLGINDLTGIKAFTNLEVLWAQQNDLVELDLEGMTTLTDVRAFNNNLARINIKGLVNLDIIGLNNNSISGINVSTNTNLRQFDIAQNDLLYLDISGLNGLTEMNVQNNSLLACIQVESAARATSLNGNANFRKNGATTFSNTCTAIYTQIPDRNFEQSLVNQNIDSEGGIPNGLVLTADIENELTLDISNQGINDLTGLEAFASLEILDVSNNDLNSLELQNLSLIEIYANDCNLAGKPIRFQNAPPNGAFLTNVTTLEIQNNGIGSAGSTISFGGVPNVTYLDISDNNFETIQLNESTSIETLLANNCPNLTTLANLGSLGNLESLGASFSSLSELDVSQNGQLSFLNISGNTLTSLDLSNNDVIGSVYAGDNDLSTISLPTTTTLSELYLENNALTVLDVSTADQNLFDLDATGNPNLLCIQLSNLDFAQRAWSIDTGTSYSTNCSPQPFTVTASIPGTSGNPPAIEITEGNSFALNFDSGTTVVDGVNYTPNVTIQRNGVDAAADFTITGLNQPITANNGVNPDGSIQFTANDDGNDTGDQVYTITVASENTAAYTLQTPETFEVTVTDALNAPILLRTTVIGATPNGNIYEIIEGQTLDIQIEALNGVDGTSFTIPLDLSNTTAQSADYTGPETSFDVTVDANANPDGVLTYLIVANDGDDAGEVLDIILDQPVGYQWEEVAGDGFLRISVTINEPSGSVFTVIPSVTGDVTGTSPNFEIIEGQTFFLNFEADEFALDGTEYNPQVFIIKDGFEDSSDFEIDNLFKTITVNSNNPDGFIEFTAIDDGVNSGDKVYEFEIFSDDNQVYTIQDSFTFTVIIKNKFNPNQPFAVDISFEGNIQIDEVGSPLCCFWYFVEEGEKITINYNAEPQAPEGSEYRVNLNVTNNGFAPEGSVYIPFNNNTDDYSFTENIEEELVKVVNNNEIDGFTQLTIADNVDEGDTLEYFTLNFESQNNLNLLGADESGNYTFVIIEAPFAQFQTIISNASEPSEEQPQAVNGEVFFKVDNPNVEDIKVQFKLTGSATYLVDYQLSPMENIEVVDEDAQIFSIPLDQNGEASVVVVPIDEDANNQEPEPTESVIFTLVDSFGYKVQEGEFAEVSILDTDKSTNFVFLADVADNNQLIFEDESRGSTSFFEVLLLDQDNNALTASEDILVKFSIQREDNQPITGVDYLIFDGNDNNKIDISQNNEFYVTINSGENRGLISVEALPDTVVEPQNESIQIQLNSGSNYEVRQIEKTASIAIVSEQRGDQFDPSQILATVSSPTCPGFNEGSISVANNTQFNFIAELLPTQENVPNQELAQDSDIVFDELPVGEYEIRLTAIDNEEIIPPSFKLTIRKNLNSTQLLSSMVNSEKKEASLKVSGSKFYEVLINDKSYQHRFENDGPNEINLPLQIGKNSIQIIGETQCQGIIDHEIFFNDLKIFPNPTNSIVHIDGLSSTNNLKLIFYDTTGKVVATFERLNQKSSNWEVNVESLSKGTYLCKIISEDEIVNTLKLIKN